MTLTREPPTPTADEAPGGPWFHGAAAGKTVGEWILPPDFAYNPDVDVVRRRYMRRLDVLSERASLYGAGALKAASSPRIYLTDSLELAARYAAEFRHGAVYECEPDGLIEEDPWIVRLPFIARALRCPRAHIVREFPLTPAAQAQILATRNQPLKPWIPRD
jgi:hypothetical protein